MNKKYEILKKYFGYDSFRQGQETLIDGILQGRDVFGIMPTGSGKSLCFQIPALIMEGITLVISPLISLMKDQVATLNQAGIHAAYLNSSLTSTQYYKALSLAKERRYPIIYVAPERLETEGFLDFALNSKIAMVAVDEAHCVSQWGQDFRPSYLKIVEFIKKLPKRPVVSAFTATATKEVREDIIDILLLREPVVVTTGYDRPNLYLGVQAPKDKYGALKNFIKSHQGQCGIVYCLTRKLVEEVSNRLKEDKISTTRYHAGLSDQERRQNQDDFIYDRCQVMVATNAFGMGIDKSNVRFVIHYNMPKSIEAFYQEIGRCSRDQEPGECILFYSGQDVVTNQRFIDNNEDNQELDSLTRRIVQERDREQLKKMTFYCFTNECLRDYILKYFGEYGANYCGNCQNCMTQFESIDVTEIAKALIGCVSTSRQRYGATVITDTVHGADTIKIRQYHMKENPFYGILSHIPIYRLRQVMNHLMLNNYLAVTNDEYSIIKLTQDSKKITEHRETVTMKMGKEQERSNKEKGERKVKRRKIIGVELSQEDEYLFERLRLLRTEIARKEGVPPYIVFSDKTLVSMSLIKPRSKEEMLSVSGVGEFKFEKYGEKFLTCVKAISPAYEEEDLFLIDEENDFNDWNLGNLMEAREYGNQERTKEFKLEKEKTENVRVTSRAAMEEKRANRKTEFVMTEELAEQIHYSKLTTLSDFVGQINDLRDFITMKRLTIKSVEDWLTENGCFRIQMFNRRPRKWLTDQGRDFGIVAEKRVSESGKEYEIFFYTQEAQKRIVQWLLL